MKTKAIRRGLYILVASVLVLMGLIGCSKLPSLDDIPIDTPDPHAPSEFYMTSKYEVYSPKTESLTFIFTNNTDTRVVYGEEYSLDKLNEGMWAEVPFKYNVYFSLVAYGVEPGQTREWELTPSYLLNELESGIYRLRKNCSYGELENLAEFTVSATFIIK